MRATQLTTPQVLVDVRRLEANLDRMQAAVSRRGLRLRPHAKTHKSPRIARWQIERGAVGICCAKIGEAEVFAAAGIEDLRLPYPVQPSNAARLLALMDRAHVSIIVDHPAVASGWSDAMRAAGRRLDVLVKVDVGFHRCGIDAGAPGAVDFLRHIAACEGLSLVGLLSHAGQGYHARSEEELAEIARGEAQTLADLAAAARGAGLDLPEISVGSTPTIRHSLEQDGLTEARPGNYVYLDRTQVALGAARLTDCALTVLASVVSRPAPDRLVLDCGSKTLSSDLARGFEPAEGFGAVFTDLEAVRPDRQLVVERLSEEHAVVRLGDPSIRLAPGDLVRVLPNHACVVSNLVDCIRLVEGLEVVETLAVEARGRIS